MSILPQPIPIIGGPLHGCQYHGDVPIIYSPVPLPLHQRSLAAWGVEKGISEIRLLKTEYERRSVDVTWGALQLRGNAYIWKEGDFGSPRQILMTILGWMAAKELHPITEKA